VDSLLLSFSKPLPLDVIPYCLLKSCHSTFAILLARLADVSFATGKLPDIYKISQISPLRKKPSLDASDPSSYRPISNLRTLGKLLERLAQMQLRPFLLASPAFSPYQSAYRPGFSTETSALFIADKLFRSSAPSLLVSWTYPQPLTAFLILFFLTDSIMILLSLILPLPGFVLIYLTEASSLCGRALDLLPLLLL